MYFHVISTNSDRSSCHIISLSERGDVFLCGFTSNVLHHYHVLVALGNKIAYRFHPLP